MDGWVDAQQAADTLEITRRSVYDYAKRIDGFPQPTYVGRTPLWREEELIAWRKAHPTRRPHEQRG